MFFFAGASIIVIAVYNKRFVVDAGFDQLSTSARAHHPPAIGVGHRPSLLAAPSKHTAKYRVILRLYKNFGKLMMIAAVFCVVELILMIFFLTVDKDKIIKYDEYQPPLGLIDLHHYLTAIFLSCLILHFAYIDSEDERLFTATRERAQSFYDLVRARQTAVETKGRCFGMCGSREAPQEGDENIDPRLRGVEVPTARGLEAPASSSLASTSISSVEAPQVPENKEIELDFCSSSENDKTI